MAEQRISMTEFRKTASVIINRVHYTGEPVTLTMKGRPMVRLIPIQEPDHDVTDSEA